MTSEQSEFQGEVDNSARPEMITVTQSTDWQGLVLFVGDTMPIILGDIASVIGVPSHLDHPVQRAVTAARLRAWADLIDPPSEPLMQIAEFHG